MDSMAAGPRDFLAMTLTATLACAAKKVQGPGRSREQQVSFVREAGGTMQVDLMGQ
jgi:hypothetical protein